MGEKIIFRYISSSFTYTNNIRKFNLIIKIERSSDLNALFLFI